MTEKINWVVICTAIAALTIIEVVALCQGINGTLMVLMVATIAGLAGWITPTPAQIVK